MLSFFYRVFPTIKTCSSRHMQSTIKRPELGQVKIVSPLLILSTDTSCVFACVERKFGVVRKREADDEKNEQARVHQ